jgi:hypothetical protein
MLTVERRSLAREETGYRLLTIIVAGGRASNILLASIPALVHPGESRRPVLTTRKGLLGRVLLDTRLGGVPS